MRNKHIEYLIIIIAILCCVTGCTSTKNRDTETIPLPDEEATVSDMSIDEEGNLILAMDKTSTGGLTADVAVWKTDNDGKEWKKLFKKTLKSPDDERITVEPEIYIAGSGAIVRQINYIGDSLVTDATDTYYTSNFGRDDFKKIFQNNPIKVFDGIGCYGEEIYINYTSDDKIMKFNPAEEMLTAAENMGKYESVYYMQSDSRYIYMVCSVHYEPTWEEENGMAYVSPSKFIRGRRYDMQKKEVAETEVLNQLAVRFYEKWQSGDADSYKQRPVFFPDLASEEEAYYLAHNDGLFRLDKNGEELIYEDKSWKGEENEVLEIVVTADGDIYLYVFKDHYTNHELVKITP